MEETQIYYPDVFETPIYHQTQNEDLTRSFLIKDHKAIVDRNNGEVFAVTSESYKLLKYEDIIGVIDGVIKRHPEYGDPIKKVQTINGGAKLSVDWTFPEVEYKITEGDIVHPSIHGLSSYDTSTLLSVLFGAFRIFCSNGLVIGDKFVHYKKKHTQIFNLQAIENAISTGMENFSNQVNLWKTWADKYTTSSEYEHVMSTMKFNKAETEEIHEVVEKSSGIGLDEIKTRTLTYWIFYNILTQYITHKVKSKLRKFQLNEQLRKVF